MNCLPSQHHDQDRTLEIAESSGVLTPGTGIPPSIDLRESWWDVRDQGSSGDGVGFAAADGLLRWHYVEAGLIERGEWLAPRFLSLAAREVGSNDSRPASFVESTGIAAKRVLEIARRWGSVLEEDLPTSGGLYPSTAKSFYSRASRLRIDAYFNLGTNPRGWKRWIASRGPVLVRLRVDDAFMDAGPGRGRLRSFDPRNVVGGHAVTLVGYTPRDFIVRNSWGACWGEWGFVLISNAYARSAVTEAYGVVLPQRRGRPKPLPSRVASAWETPSGEPLCDPELDGFVIEFAFSYKADKQRTDRLINEVLGPEAAQSWSLEPMHPSTPRVAVLRVTGGRAAAMDVAAAWEICYRLRAKRDEVSFAEPCFLINHDNDPEDRRTRGREDSRAGTDAAELPLARRGKSPFPVVDPDWRDWSPLLISARAAWELPPKDHGGKFANGRRMGEDVVVAHPDSGWWGHDELADLGQGGYPRILTERDYDFVDCDKETLARPPDGKHGTGTASVIMSREADKTGPEHPKNEVTGVAPRAQLAPLRVAEKRIYNKTVILLRGSNIRLARAIRYAICQDFHVISISLGGIWNCFVRQALEDAVAGNIIVCAAAGNKVRYFVVWPARYCTTLAIAGCDYKAKPYEESSRGKRVDVTAPGKSVWRASLDGDLVDAKSGTSYATASVAGIAALWLAHWGRDYLLHRYRERASLNEVFREVIEKSCIRPPKWNTSKWGAGLVNAERTLCADLPDGNAVAKAVAVAREKETKRAGLPLPFLSDLLEELGEETSRVRLSTFTGIARRDLDHQLAAVDEELAFHIVTNAALRQAIFKGAKWTPKELRRLPGLSTELKSRLR